MKSDSKQIALRIGLAARELPDTDVATLMQVLDDLVSLPPTSKALSGLRLQDLKNASDGALSEIDDVHLTTALEILSGKKEMPNEALPKIQAYSEGDMPNSIRVACASNNGARLDGHFGSCSRFLIYQVSEVESRLLDIRDIHDSQAEEDKNAYRAGLIQDCQLLFVASIGGPAAAKVVRLGIHPIKKPQSGPSEEVIRDLLQAIAKDAPPWLAKVMGQSPEDRIRFDQENSELEVRA